VRRLTSIGIFVVAIGFVALSRVETLLAFYAATIVIAVGMSATGGATANVAITQWFRRKRGRALGLMTLGGGVSGLSAVFLAWVIGALGWRDAMVAIGLGQLVLCLPLALTMRDRPSDIGAVVDGEPEPEPAPGAVAVAPARLTGPELTAGQALKSATFWKIAIAFALGNFATTAIIVHQVPFLEEEVGTSEGIAALSITLVTFISIGGRLTFGPLADKYPAVRLLAVAMALLAAGLVALATVREQWQLLYAVPLFGLGFGAVIPLRPLMQAEYFGLRAFGTIQGVTMTVTTIFAVAGPVLAGALYDASGTYRLAFMLLALGPLSAIPLALSMGKARSAEPAIAPSS
jgi:sugar phosphate permease